MCGTCDVIRRCVMCDTKTKIGDYEKCAGDASTLTVYQDGNYNYVLGRLRDKPGVHLAGETQEVEPMGLWHVTFYLDDILTERYVLAEDEQGAIGQATCEIHYNHRDERVKGAMALKIPVRLRGWGKQEF
jgi:hypothetical protein